MAGMRVERPCALGIRGRRARDRRKRDRLLADGDWSPQSSDTGSPDSAPEATQSSTAMAQTRYPFRRMTKWPQDRMSNGGRVYRIAPDDDGDPDDIPGSLVLGHEGEPVARLEPPEDDPPPRTDGMVEWTLWFQAGRPKPTILGA